MLIVAGRAWANGFFAQTRIEGFAMQIGEFVEQRFGPAASGEDAPDRCQGESAEADGAFQSLLHIVALILSQKRQQLLRLEFALDLFGQEAIKERQSDRTEFAEALPQEQLALMGIVSRMVALERLPNARLCAGHERMAGDLFQADGVNDDFPLGDAHGKHLADVRPRHRVKVEPMRDVALDVDMAIHNRSGIEVTCGQREQVRLLDGMSLER